MLYFYNKEVKITLETEIDVYIGDLFWALYKTETIDRICNLIGLVHDYL